ncbi:MAG: signal peptide peptidase SppA [Desulfomicrobiaceae bacterium]|nr:signal peptide peptidase SppA [Desulfomicrobiaceae bacterium]
MLFSISNLLRRLWRAIDISRRVVLNALFVLLAASILLAAFTDRTPQIPRASVLRIDLAGPLVEETPEPTGVERLLLHLAPHIVQPAAIRVTDVVRVLRAAAHDPRIALVEIQTSGVETDLAKLHTLAQEIRLLRQSGKPVWTHSDLYTQAAYLVAAACDRVSLHPLGAVLLTGFGFYPLHFKKLLDDLRIDVTLLRAGTYKSAAEPLVRDSMSEETRAATRAWLDTLWRAFRMDIAQSRNIPAETVHRYAQDLDRLVLDANGDAALLARRQHLVDAVETYDAFQTAMAKHLGHEDPAELSKVSLEEYAATLPARTPTKDAVAVVRAQGAIVPEADGTDAIAADALVERLQRAASDPRTRALVLRLDSPGGSAAAAEDIRSALARIRDTGMPVVVSFGAMGASGAYWIATAATRILAEPMTLTGSIGVFATIPNLTRTAQHLGVTSDGVGTTELADQTNPLRPLSARTTAALEANLQHTYRRFQSLVAQARGFEAGTISRLAQGQVWTGEAAKAQHLVDAVGGEDLAVTMAASLAGVPDAPALEFRPEPQPIDLLATLVPDRVFAPAFRLLAPLSPLAHTLAHGGIFAWAVELTTGWTTN